MWNMENLVIHIAVYMILTASMFLIICVQLCLNFSPSQLFRNQDTGVYVSALNMSASIGLRMRVLVI